MSKSLMYTNILGFDSRYAIVLEGFILFQGVRFILSVTYSYVVG